MNISKLEETLEYQNALQEATHKGINSGTLYRVDDGSLSCDFFGVSSLTWRKAMMYNTTLDNNTYVKL